MKDTCKWIDQNDKNNTGEKRYVWNGKKNNKEEKQMQAQSCQPS